MWSLGPHADNPEWNVADTETSIDLVEVVQTVVGPYAVGGGGVLVANRDDEGDPHEWEVVLDDGPSASDNALRAMDVTDDGERLWFAGSSGAMACYDVKQRRKFSYSYPEEMTSTWEGIAVAGERGSEKVLVANSSGVVLPFQMDGFEAEWGTAEKPMGRAAGISALSASPDGVGYAVDTSGNAFRTTQDEGWEDIGIVNAQVKFFDVYAGAKGRVYVAAGDGRLYRYDDSYHDWTPIGVAEGTPLRAVDVYPHPNKDTLEMVVLGNDGTIYQRTGKERWKQLHPEVTADLFDLALGRPDVATGGNGTVIYRHRSDEKTNEKSKDGDNFEGRGERYDSDADDGSTSGSDTTDSDTSDPDDTDDTDDPDSNDTSDSEDTSDSTSDSTSDDSTDDDSTSDSTSDDSTSDSTSDDSTSDDSTSDDSTSDDSTSDDSTSDDSTSDDSTSDSTSDDSTSDGEKELEIEADYEDGSIYLVIDVQDN